MGLGLCSSSNFSNGNNLVEYYQIRQRFSVSIALTNDLDSCEVESMHRKRRSVLHIDEGVTHKEQIACMSHVLWFCSTHIFHYQ